MGKPETQTPAGSRTPWLDAAAPDQSRPPYRVEFGPEDLSEAEVSGSDRAIVGLLDGRPDGRPSWLDIEAGFQVPLRAAKLDPMLLTNAAILERERLASGAAARAPLARSLAWRLKHPAPYSILWCYSEVLMHWAAWTQQHECLGRVRE